MSDAHVVVGHDGHAGSEVALAAAVDLAGRIAAHLHVVHAVTLADYGVDPDTEAFEETRDRNLIASRYAVPVAPAGSPSSWTCHEESGGDPPARMAELAEQTGAAYTGVGASLRR